MKINLSKAFKDFFPQLDNVLRRDNEDTEGSLGLKKTLRKSLMASATAASLWDVAILDDRFHFLPKVLSFPLSIAFAASSIYSLKVDARFARQAFSRVKKLVSGNNDSEEETKNAISKLVSGANLVYSGMMQNPRLARNIIICSAVEAASDILDAYADASRNPLLSIGSTFISITVGLKDLDLALKAYQTGLENEGSKRDIPPSVRLMKSFGMHRSADIVLIELAANPKLKGRLNSTDNFCIGGVATTASLGVTNLGLYGVFADPSILKRYIRDGGLLLAASAASAGASTGLLALAYRNGSRRSAQNVIE